MALIGSPRRSPCINDMLAGLGLELKGSIGSGSFGNVYVACSVRDPFECKIAVKVVWMYPTTMEQANAKPVWGKTEFARILGLSRTWTDDRYGRARRTRMESFEREVSSMKLAGVSGLAPSLINNVICDGVTRPDDGRDYVVGVIVMDRWSMTLHDAVASGIKIPYGVLSGFSKRLYDHFNSNGQADFRDINSDGMRGPNILVRLDPWGSYVQDMVIGDWGMADTTLEWYQFISVRGAYDSDAILEYIIRNSGIKRLLVYGDTLPQVPRRVARGRRPLSANMDGSIKNQSDFKILE